MKSLSLVMIVLNEEEKLARCLESVKGIVDEIIIVDTGSTDATKLIASQFGAKIYDFVWVDHFAEARNYALKQSTSDWNMVLDADDYIVNDCGQAIRDFINKHNAIGRFKIKEKTLSNGEINYVQNINARLFPKGVFYTGRIHEQLDSNLPRYILPVEVEHDGYYETSKSKRNIPLLELELLDDPNDAYILFQLSREYKGLDQIDKASRYISKAYSLLTKRENFYPLVVIDYIYIIMALKDYKTGLKLIVAEQVNLSDYPDFHFVTGLFYLDFIMSDPQKYIHFLPKIEQAYLRCLELGETDRYDSVIGTGSFSALHNLGVFYEVQGQVDKAISYYKQAANYSHEPSLRRLEQLRK